MNSLPKEIKLYIFQYIGSPTAKIIKKAFENILYLSYVPKINRLKNNLELFNDLDPEYMKSNTYSNGQIIRLNLPFKDCIFFGPYVGII